MEKKVRILGIQLNSEPGNKKANLEKAQKFIEESADFKPDLIVLPEVFNTGTVHDRFHELAEPVPGGETTELLSGLALKYSANILSGSFIEKLNNGNFANSSVLFDRSGKIISKYHKIHMYSYYGSSEGKYITPGNSAVIAETDIGKIGLTICYDLRFPELYRSLNFAGAEIIVCPAAWPHPRGEHWKTLNKARAIENQVYFVSVNQVGPAENGRINAGNSMILNPKGEITASAGTEETVMKAEIDLNRVKTLREEFPVLNDRKDQAYGNILKSL